MTSIQYANGQTIGYDYIDSKRTSTAYNGIVKFEYKYSTSNNIENIVDKVNNVFYTIQYDDNESVISITGTDGSSLQYQYGNADLVSSITSTINGTSKTITYSYDDSNNLTDVTTVNGSTISYAYDSLNRIDYRDVYLINGTYRVGYTYVDGDNDTTTGKISSISNNGTVTEYAYDANGNISTITSGGKLISYTYNSLDELVRENNQVIDKTIVYSYDAGHQLAAISGNGQTISYKYNDSGYRTERTVNGVTTKYYLDGDKVVLENNGTDSVYYSYDSDDKLISMTLNGTEYFYILNGQGDITGLIDTSGTQVVSYTYDSWGELISIDGSLKDTVGLKNPYRYRDYRYDTETEFFYVGSRYYNSEIGRFISAEAAEILGLSDINPLCANLFTYCYNNPVMYSLIMVMKHGEFGFGKGFMELQQV